MSTVQNMRERTASSQWRLLICLGVGAVAAGVALVLGGQTLAPLVGWDAAAAVFIAWLVLVISRAGQTETQQIAVSEDSSGPVADVVLLAAAVASLVGVGVLLTQGAAKGGPSPSVAIAVGLVTVVLSWAVVHLIFTTRYARLYYAAQVGGIDFNEPDRPRYADFAYLAFTIGMTFQVSDTDLTDKRIRATALRHALLSYLFGAVILASTINLLAGLAK